MENDDSSKAMEIDDVGESAQAQKLRKCMEQKIAELNAFKINFTRPEDQLMATGNAQGAPARLENQRLDREWSSGLSRNNSPTGKERAESAVKRKVREVRSKRNQTAYERRRKSMKPSTGTFGVRRGGARKSRKRKSRKRKLRKRKTRKRKPRKRNKRVKRRKKTRKRRR